MTARSILAVLAAMAALVAVGWWSWSNLAAVGWDLPGHLWAALIIGVVATIALGAGLMFLVFYSSRKGYDESARGPGA
jgi:hypothetical protein